MVYITTIQNIYLNGMILISIIYKLVKIMRNEQKHKIIEEESSDKKSDDSKKNEEIEELLKLRERVEKNLEVYKEYDKEIKKYPYSCLL